MYLLSATKARDVELWRDSNGADRRTYTSRTMRPHVLDAMQVYSTVDVWFVSVKQYQFIRDVVQGVRLAGRQWSGLLFDPNSAS